jgi:single-strand DNA-binding protein
MRPRGCAPTLSRERQSINHAGRKEPAPRQEELMASINKVILVGNAGRDPEIRYLPSGNAVANFSLATSENWNNKNGEREERTEWHRIAAFGRLADYCSKSVFKGQQLNVEGRLQTRQWEDRDGNKRYTTEVVASYVQVLAEGGEMSKAVLIGRVEAAPEIRQLTSGKDLATFNLISTSRRENREGGAEERSETHRIVAFGKLAEICGRFLTPSKLVYIEGRIQTREWQDQEGNLRRTTECVANNMQMLGSRGDSERQNPKPAESVVAEHPEPTGESKEDEIPF